MVERIRVLIAKPGLDGHDRGAKIVARALSEAGMEVIYTGIRQTVEQIVTAAVQEDVDVIGLSSLAGAHDTLFPQIIDMLRKKGKGDILVLGGGTVPPADAKRLREYGIAEIFGPGTKTQDIIAFIKKTAKSSRVRGES